MLRSLVTVALITVLLSVSTTITAQNTRNNSSNTNAWLMYFGNHQLSKTVGLHAEVQLRRHNFLADHQQLLLRTGVDFHTKSGSRFTVGYGFIQTHPYGSFPVANAFPEHRIWQQYLTTQSIGKFKLSHRYRLEQRFIGNAATGEFANGRYENRVRYMAKVTTNLTSGDRPIFAAVYDELFINFGKEVAFNLLDQNRLYGALGFTLSPVMKLEVGYLYQMVQLRSLDTAGLLPQNRIENNHTFQLGLFSTLPFIKAE